MGAHRRVGYGGMGFIWRLEKSVYVTVKSMEYAPGGGVEVVGA